LFSARSVPRSPSPFVDERERLDGVDVGDVGRQAGPVNDEQGSRPLVAAGSLQTASPSFWLLDP
jgi:hypothetical protein